MSKPTFMKILCVLAAALLSAGLWTLKSVKNSDGLASGFPTNKKELFESAVHVPAGTYRTGSREPGCYQLEDVNLDAFYIWPTEVPIAFWRAYKPEDERARNVAMPITGVSQHEAAAFCRWLSRRLNIHARLPTRHEWEVAARSGKSGVTYSWGWVKNDAHQSSTVRPVTSGHRSSWGLHHMSGNVAEWCADAGDSETAPVMGGSWAERDSKFHRISHKLELPKDYRDADVGFRFVIEADARQADSGGRIQHIQTTN